MSIEQQKRTAGYTYVCRTMKWKTITKIIIEIGLCVKHVIQRILEIMFWILVVVSGIEFDGYSDGDSDKKGGRFVDYLEWFILEFIGIRFIHYD